MTGKNIKASSKTLDIVIPVYNDAPYLEESLNSIYNQQLTDGWQAHIYVVDDGSDKPIKVDIPNDKAHRLSVIRLDENSGCSVARNKGAFAGNGEVILFLDADCSFAHKNVLSLLLEQYEEGFDVCFGQIYAPQGDFWASYQNMVAKERSERFKRGEHFSMTTQIFMVKKEVFKVVGGFDEAYHFGFEDRDLFINLLKKGVKACLVEKALVNHNDQISLNSVTRKLYQSGETLSMKFIKEHPDEYIMMGYARADVRFSKGGLKLLVFLSKPFLWPMIKLLDGVLKKEKLAFFIAKKLMKFATGLAYLHGTAAARKS